MPIVEDTYLLKCALKSLKVYLKIWGKELDDWKPVWGGRIPSTGYLPKLLYIYSVPYQPWAQWSKLIVELFSRQHGHLDNSNIGNSLLLSRHKSENGVAKFQGPYVDLGKFF